MLMTAMFHDIPPALFLPAGRSLSRGALQTADMPCWGNGQGCIPSFALIQMSLVLCYHYSPMEDRYAFAEKYGLNDSRVIDVSSCVSPLGPSRKVKAAIRRAVRFIGREPDAGQRKLKRYFSSRFGLQADALCFANSLRELLAHVISAAGARRVLVQGPALPLCEEAARAAGAAVQYVHATAENGFAMDAEGILAHAGGHDLLVIASPNRITGRSVERDTLRTVLSAAAGRGIVVVLDESLAGFVAGADGLREPSSGAHHVVLGTTAFYYGLPGLELAYAIAPLEISGAVRRMQTAPPDSLALEAAHAAFRDAAYRKEVRDFVEKESAWLMRELRRTEGITCLESDTHLFLLKVEAGREDVSRALVRAGFFIRDCGDVPGMDPAYLRCCLLKHEKNVRLMKLLKSSLQRMSVAD